MANLNVFNIFFLEYLKSVKSLTGNFFYCLCESLSRCILFIASFAAASTWPSACMGDNVAEFTCGRVGSFIKLIVYINGSAYTSTESKAKKITTAFSGAENSFTDRSGVYVIFNVYGNTCFAFNKFFTIIPV